MTGRDLITASLRLIGATAPGESLAASEATDGLASLNRLLGSLSNERLMIHALVREAVALTPNTAAYTMGTSGTYSLTRAQRIDHALIRDESTVPAVEYPVRVLRSLDEWATIRVKDVTSTYPTDLYADGAFPAETITLHPVPTYAHKLVLYSWKPLTQIATLDTDISFPSGYDRMLIFNLAMDLAPEYGKAVPDAVAMNAVESKAQIKRMNSRPAYLRVSDVPASSGNGRFNIYTGDYR